MARRGAIYHIRRARAQYSSFPCRYTVIRYRMDRRRTCVGHEKVMEITTMWGSLRLAPIIQILDPIHLQFNFSLIFTIHNYVRNHARPTCTCTLQNVTFACTRTCTCTCTYVHVYANVTLHVIRGVKFSWIQSKQIWWGKSYSKQCRQAYLHIQEEGVHSDESWGSTG